MQFDTRMVARLKHWNRHSRTTPCFVVDLGTFRREGGHRARDLSGEEGATAGQFPHKFKEAWEVLEPSDLLLWTLGMVDFPRSRSSGVRAVVELMCGSSAVTSLQTPFGSCPAARCRSDLPTSRYKVRVHLSPEARAPGVNPRGVLRSERSYSQLEKLLWTSIKPFARPSSNCRRGMARIEAVMQAVPTRLLRHDDATRAVGGGATAWLAEPANCCPLLIGPCPVRRPNTIGGQRPTCACQEPCAKLCMTFKDLELALCISGANCAVGSLLSVAGPLQSSLDGICRWGLGQNRQGGRGLDGLPPFSSSRCGVRGRTLVLVYERRAPRTMVGLLSIEPHEGSIRRLGRV